MALDLADLPEEYRAFLAERHLGTLTTLRPDGTPHVVPVGFVFDEAAGLVRVITSATSRKARNVIRGGGSPAAVCQVDGPRWATLEGPAAVRDDPAAVAAGETAYAARYRPPRENPQRVVIEIRVERAMGRG